MPCNTVQTNTVKLEKALENESLLEKGLNAEFTHVRKIRPGVYAFRADGYDVTMNGPAFQSTLSASRLGEVVGRVKQSYSREAVKLAAKRFGWTIEKGADVNHFTIVKN